MTDPPPRSRCSWLAAPQIGAGRAGVAILLAALLAHLAIATRGPNGEGFLFGGGVLREALGESVLLVAPLLALYAGLRGVRHDRDDLAAYLAIAGGGVLTLATGAGLVLVLL